MFTVSYILTDYYFIYYIILTWKNDFAEVSNNLDIYRSENNFDRPLK